MLKARGITVVMVILGLWLCLPNRQALAVPSFARQTGLDCNACHTVYPELTPTGRNFKLNGYTASKHADKQYEWPPPVSAMVQLSFTNTRNAMPPNVAAGFDPNGDQGQIHVNDNVAVPQALSLYYAGRIYGPVGAFIQGTYDGIMNKFMLDHIDARFTHKFQLADKDLLFGLTMNNNPTVQDVLNTTAFRFPWVTSAVAPTPAAAPIVDDALALQVGGLGAYLYWNNLIYAEFTVYRTARFGITQFMGAGSVTDTLVQDYVPYWRIFLNKQWGKHSLQVGHFGLVSRNLIETGVAHLIDTRGPIDRFTDLGFDAQYQFIGKKHIFTAQTAYIHEDQRLNASFAAGNSVNNSNWLDTWRLNFNYYYRSSWGDIGGSAGYFNTWGSKDTGLYAPDPGDGSNTGKPNSDGFILELDYVPWWQYTKFTLQYTIYNRFNGSRSNYDGFGRNASSNNTLFLLIWQTF